MKYLKNFSQVFESGIPSSETRELESAIKELISSGSYRPNITNDRGFLPSYLDDKETRDFNVGVSGNHSKFGIVIEVSFRLDFPVGYDEINVEFKQGTLPLEIIDTISQVMSKSVKLYGFEFFGSKVMGQKDGRTLEVEDVLPKFDLAVEQLDSTPDKVSNSYSPIIFWFLVK